MKQDLETYSLEDSEPTYGEVNDAALSMLRPPSINWYIAVCACVAAVALGLYCWGLQISRGMGLSGKTHPVMLGLYVTNFVFWIGLAHAGTLISAILYLFRASFRRPIHRFAEAMTVFAVITAALFPLIHLGRGWLFYWLLLYPNQRGLWPNFKSPLSWDVFAIGTYFIVSLLFLGVGLIPDLAALRDRVPGFFRRIFYGFAALGWSGSQDQWRHYQAGYLVLASLAAVLVISVHSVVSWDFAMTLVPGWHGTIFAPYFVVGAIFSGLAMVIVLTVLLRRVYRLEYFIRAEHLESVAKLLLAASLALSYCYLVEFYMAWYSNNPFERAQFSTRPTGAYALPFWIAVFCNSVAPLSLILKKVRSNLVFVFAISVLASVGMWFERFSIIVQSLAHDYLPAAWGGYSFSWIDLGITLGAIAWFSLLMLIFIKMFPAIAISEMKEILPMPLRGLPAQEEVSDARV